MAYKFHTQKSPIATCNIKKYWETLKNINTSLGRMTVDLTSSETIVSILCTKLFKYLLLSLKSYWWVQQKPLSWNTFSLCSINHPDQRSYITAFVPSLCKSCSELPVVHPLKARHDAARLVCKGARHAVGQRMEQVETDREPSRVVSSSV